MRLRGWAEEGRACVGRGLAEISAFSMSLMAGSAGVSECLSTLGWLVLVGGEQADAAEDGEGGA